MSDTQVIGFRFSKKDVENLDALVARMGCKNRTDCIKQLITDRLDGGCEQNLEQIIIEILKTNSEVRGILEGLTQKSLQQTIDKVMKLNIKF